VGLLAVGAAGLVTIVLTLAAALAALGGASMDAGGLASEGAGASALART